MNIVSLSAEIKWWRTKSKPFNSVYWTFILRLLYLNVFPFIQFIFCVFPICLWQIFFFPIIVENIVFVYSFYFAWHRCYLLPAFNWKEKTNQFCLNIFLLMPFSHRTTLKPSQQTERWILNAIPDFIQLPSTYYDYNFHYFYIYY